MSTRPASVTKAEPVLSAALFVTLVTNVLDVLIAFGLDLTVDQTAKLIALTNTVALLVGAWYARRHSTPNASLDALAVAREEAPAVVVEEAGDVTIEEAPDATKAVPAKKAAKARKAAKKG